MQQIHGFREHRKIVRAFDAYQLNRRGYWSCDKCTAHNPNWWFICSVCNAPCWKSKMPTEVLSIGYPVTLVQNRIYALPGARCLLFCQVAAATLFQSNELAFTNSVAVVFTSGMCEMAGGFIKNTAVDVIVTLKKA